MDSLLQDVRYTLRLMSRNKGFTVAAVLTLALGIGINTGVFSLVYGVLLRPLPYSEPDRLVRLSEEHTGAKAAFRAALLSNLTYYAWGESPRTLEGIAAYSSDRVNLTGLEEPIRVEAASVSPALFTILRKSPSAGRFFLPSEASGNAAVAVISDSFWRQQLGADIKALGRLVTIDGRAHTIIGIAPPGFYFPNPETRLWTPFSVDRPKLGPGRGGSVSVFHAVARLRPGVTAAQAEAEGTAAARGAGIRPLAADLLFGNGGPVQVHVRSVVEQAAVGVRPALLLLAAGVALILMIAWANLASLLLSRGLARQREFAVRAALGAGRSRMVRQILTETLLLSLFGGALGFGLGWLLTQLLPAIAPQDFPRLTDVRIDGKVRAFAALASIIAGLLAGLAPTLRNQRSGVSLALHGGSRYSEGGLRSTWTSRMRALLLIAEAAFAVMLLIGAGLLLRSFARLLTVDPGYDPSNVIIARLSLSSQGATAERNRQFVDALLERLRRAPGVLAAGAGSMAPFAGSTSISGFPLPASETNGNPRTAQALSYLVTPGYAEALGLRIKEGRRFAALDENAAVLTAFAGLAVLLAAVGLYGVLSYNVAQRRREMGVRAALGATRRDLVGLIVREGISLVGTGLMLGIAGAAGLTRFMSALLFGVTPLDPVAFVAAAFSLLLVAAAACYLPARRAAAADPAEVLRCE